MDQRATEIKQANQKAFPKFVLYLLACVVVGGVIGFLVGKYELYELTADLAAAGGFFARYIAAWLLGGIVILRPMICVPMYRRAKKALSNWDGEDEELLSRIDTRLSVADWIGTLFNIATYFLFSVLASVLLSVKTSDWELQPFAIAFLLLFVLSLVEGIMLQRRIVDLTLQMQPEKNGSYYERNFHKKWVDSCDEAENLRMGQCAYKAYRATNQTCLILWLIFSLSALLFGTGFLPVLTVCVIWGVSASVYTHWSIKLSPGGQPTSK